MKNLTKKEWVALTASLVVIAVFFLSGTFIFSFLTGNVNQMNDQDAAANANGANIQSANGSVQGAAVDTENLQIFDVLMGTGAEAVAGKMVTVNYTGAFIDGKKFDSSYDRGVPFTFTLGAGEVIAGWDIGVSGMKVGGKRQLLVPSVLGYGEAGMPPVIPPNSPLLFEVELLDVK